MSAEMINDRINSAFISYSRKDKDFVSRLVAAFNSLGRDVWVDWEDIPATADWRDEIYEGIRNADDFVFVISPDSIESEECTKELQLAIEMNKRLIPLLVREVQTYHPIHEALNSHNWVIFKDNDFDRTFRQLVSALDTDLEYTRAHTRLLNLAIDWDSKNRNRSTVLRGEDLDEYVTWWSSSTGKSPAPTKLQIDYILASRQAAEARRRIMFSILFIGLAISMLLTVVAIDASVKAQRAERVAQLERANAQSLLLADLAEQNVDAKNTLYGLTLALAAAQMGDPPANTQRILSEIAYAPGIIDYYPGYTPQISDLAVSADEKTAVVASENAYGVYFDIESGREISRYKNPDLMPIHSVAFSKKDENIAILGLRDWKIVFWDVETGEEVRSLGGIKNYRYGQENIAHRGAINALDVSDGGELIASGSSDYTVIIWNYDTGEPLRQLPAQGIAGHNGRITDVVFSKDAKYLLSGAEDGLVILWDTTTGFPLRYFKTPGGNVRTVAFSPDEQSLVAGFNDGTLRRWMLDLHVPSTELLATMGNRGDISHFGAVTDVVFSPGGERVISSGSDGSIIIWDASDGDGLFYLRGVRDSVDQMISENVLKISKDGRRVMTGADNGTITIWDVTNEAVANYYSLGHLDSITDSAFSLDGEQIVTVGNDFQVIGWDTFTGDINFTSMEHDAPILTVAYPQSQSENRQVDNIFATGDRGGNIFIWDSDTGEVLKRYSVADSGDVPVVDLAFTMDGKSILAALDDDNNSIIMLDVDTGNLMATFEGLERRALSIAVSPDGLHFASGDAKGQIVVWDILKQIPFIENMGHVYHTGSQTRVTSIDYDPSGEHLVSSSLDGKIFLWNATNGDFLRTFDTFSTDPIWSVQFDRTGRKVVSGDGQGAVTLWDAATGEAIRNLPKEHQGRILSVNTHPTEDYVITASDDGTALLWSMPNFQSLVDWAYENRYFVPLTCEQQLRLKIQSDECGAVTMISSDLTIVPEQQVTTDP